MSTPNPTPVPPAAAPAEKTYTQAEFVAAIEAARKEEKDKLYGDLQKAQSTISSLTSEKETLTQSLANLGKETENLKSLAEVTSKAKTPKGEIDIQKLIEEVTSKLEVTAKTTYGQKVSELESLVHNLQGTLKAKELAEARSRLVTEAGGDSALIPELVKGNNEEELKASITESKRIFESMKARISQTTATPPAGTPAATAPAATATATTPVAPPPVPPAGSATDPTAPLIRHEPTKHNPAEYASNRKNVLSSLQGRYTAR